MRAADILRKLADVIDQNSGEVSDRPRNSQPHIELEPVDVDHEDHTETTTFVAPLQAKLELLKKSVGMDNVYDQNCVDAADELGDIRRHAGITVATVHEMADDDGPFEG